MTNKKVTVKNVKLFFFSLIENSVFERCYPKWFLQENIIYKSIKQ